MACLDGMNLALAAASASTPKAQGQLLAKSPEYSGPQTPRGVVTPKRGGRSPKEMLQPADLAITQRWKSILKIVIAVSRYWIISPLAQKILAVILRTTLPASIRQTCLSRPPRLGPDLS